MMTTSGCPTSWRSKWRLLDAAPKRVGLVFGYSEVIREGRVIERIERPMRGNVQARALALETPSPLTWLVRARPGEAAALR